LAPEPPVDARTKFVPTLTRSFIAEGGAELRSKIRDIVIKTLKITKGTTDYDTFVTAFNTNTNSIVNGYKDDTVRLLYLPPNETPPEGAELLVVCVDLPTDEGRPPSRPVVSSQGPGLSLKRSRGGGGKAVCKHRFTFYVQKNVGGGNRTRKNGRRGRVSTTKNNRK
jgi:hypothetical protein